MPGQSAGALAKKIAGHFGPPRFPLACQSFFRTLKTLPAFIYPLFEMTGQLRSAAKEASQLVKGITCDLDLKVNLFINFSLDLFFHGTAAKHVIVLWRARHSQSKVLLVIFGPGSHFWSQGLV